MISTPKAIIALFIGLMLVSCGTYKKQTQVSQNNKPQNVILLIGDGMGLSQVSSSFYYGTTTPNFERFKHLGLIKTSSQSDLITDSAAGATAFSAGIKTYNSAIGMDKDTLAVKSIIDYTSQLGLSTGIVCSSSVTHATPASFYAHTKSRYLQEEIATYLPNSAIDFFAGGGKKFFFKRKDKINYAPIFKEKGFVLDTTSLKKPSNFGLQQKFGFLLANDGMPNKIDGRDDFLPNATQLGLDYLSQNKKGFFLMVEGSQIDWAGHSNKADYLIKEVLDFDKTIGVALDFAKKDGNTLVIVTADHETGGFTLASNKGNYNKISPSFSTNGHSATLIPVFAYGPGAEEFIGIYENNAIFHKIKKLSDW